jgi:hypothetical protein
MFVLLFSLGRCSSHLFAFAGATNLSLQFKSALTSPFMRAPFYAPLESSLRNRLSLFSSTFFRLSMPLVHGSSASLALRGVRFRECASPIRLTSSGKSVNKRCSYSKSEVDFDNTIYEFCHALTSDGGCLYLADCTSNIANSFFFHGVARNGGAACVSGGKVIVSDSNFVKNSAKMKCGGLLVRDCDAHIKKSKFVGNRAGGQVGALLVQASVVRLLTNLFYNNIAESHGGISLSEASGVFIECYFRGNSALGSNEGTSLAISGNIDWFCVENSRFYDTNPFPLSLAASSLTRLVDLQFVAQKQNAIFLVPDTDKAVCQIVNPKFAWTQIEPPPELPQGMMREVLAYKESEPPFAWRSLYILIALFTVVISVLVIFIPIVILPSDANLGYTKQSVQSTAAGP